MTAPVRPADRLAHPDAHVRRIALRDLAVVREWTQEDLGAVLRSLERETDPEAGVLGARLLGARLWNPARPLLASLVERPGTDVRVAHAARVALDRLDIAARRAGTRPEGPPGTMAP